MANRNISVQYKLRGDILANWSSANPVLADREPVIVVIPADSGSGMNEPAVLLKVGDGVTAFNQLGYVSAIAGDVPAWAKAETKPTYAAEEITGIDTYIAEYVNSEMGISVDTDTQYTLIPTEGNAYQFKLMSKSKVDSSYTNEVATITIPQYDDTELEGRVEGLETLVGETAVATQIATAISGLNLANTYETKGAADAAKTALIGTDDDLSTADTIKAAKKYAEEKADEKVASVGATDNSIEIGGTTTAPTVAVKVSPDVGNALTKTENGLKVTIPEAAVISVSKKAAANDGYLATYQVTVDGEPVGVDINIPKDYLVKSAEISTVETTDNPYDGAAIGDKYIDFVINTIDSDGTVTHLYLPVQDLVDEYAAGDGIDISDTNIVKIKIDTANANGLSVDASGLKLSVATGDSAGAMSAADYTKLNGISEGATKVEVSETNGNVKVNGSETTVYTLPDTVLDSNDTFIFDGGNA